MAATPPVMVNTAEPPGFRATLREIWRYRDLVLELSRRAVQLRYKNSLLGVAWSLATPLMFVFMITMVRKLFLHQDIPNYSAFLFPTMFAWMFYTMAIPEACTVLLEHAAMIRKVYFPREILPMMVVVANLVHFLVALGVTIIYLLLLRIFPWQVNVELLLLLLIIPAQCLVVLGLGLMVSSLNVLFEDVRYIVQMLMQVMLYAVPIIYPIESVAAAAQRDWGSPLLAALGPHLLDLYLLNPFASLLVLYQKAMLPPIQGAPLPALPWSWGLLAQAWVVGLVILYLGARVFQRAKWTVVERL
ncbi:MAG: ABC transporter permease [Armatimonadetes bacterium]|nr:ABC transporter permease [Armatimonadota bacterium]